MSSSWNPLATKNDFFGAARVTGFMSSSEILLLENDLSGVIYE